MAFVIISKVSFKFTLNFLTFKIFGSKIAERKHLWYNNAEHITMWYNNAEHNAQSTLCAYGVALECYGKTLLQAKI